jgi:hypothetical protein
MSSQLSAIDPIPLLMRSKTDNTELDDPTPIPAQSSYVKITVHFKAAEWLMK